MAAAAAAAPFRTFGRQRHLQKKIDRSGFLDLDGFIYLDRTNTKLQIFSQAIVLLASITTTYYYYLVPERSLDERPLLYSLASRLLESCLIRSTQSALSNMFRFSDEVWLPDNLILGRFRLKIEF